MDPKLYRRRQRRRAAIGWTALIAIAVLVAVGIIVDSGGDGGGDRTVDLGSLSVAAEMSSAEYEAIREGEEETTIVERIGSGLREADVDQGLLALFPSQPDNSHCTFWNLSDAPGHLARLCFDDDRGVMLQKSVAARGEGAVPRSLV